MLGNQANLQIKNAKGNKNSGKLEFTFDVLNGGDDTARMVRVIVLLPVNVWVENVHIEEKKTGLKGYENTEGFNEACKKCSVFWNSSVTIGRAGGDLALYYDATVSIDLAYLDVKEGVKIIIVNSYNNKPKQEFGGFLYGSNPDNNPQSNYKTAVCV